MIRVVVHKDPALVAEAASALILNRWRQTVADKSRCVLGLATGGSPIATYHRLVDAWQAGELSAEEIRHTVTFNLDEYVPPLSMRSRWRFHEQSYRCFMSQHLFSHLPFAADANHLPDTSREDPELACVEYERQIAASGGIDFQLLGIGGNGHIGFCEPGTAAADTDARTQCVDLAPQTIEDNARKFFGGRIHEVPRQAVSMGMGTILAARGILLLATGPEKATAVAASVLGPVTSFCPASQLQTHDDVVYVIDESAAALILERLERADEGFGGSPKPGAYQVISETGVRHEIEIDESMCEIPDFEEDLLAR